MFSRITQQKPELQFIGRTGRGNDRSVDHRTVVTGCSLTCISMTDSYNVC